MWTNGAIKECSLIFVYEKLLLSLPPHFPPATLDTSDKSDVLGNALKVVSRTMSRVCELFQSHFSKFVN